MQNEIFQIKNLLTWTKENKIFFKNKKTFNWFSIEFEKKDFLRYNNFNDFVDGVEEYLYYNGITIKGNFKEFLQLQNELNNHLTDLLLHFDIFGDFEYLTNFDSKEIFKKYYDALNEINLNL